VAGYSLTFTEGVMIMAQVAILREEIPIPEGVEVTINDEVVVTGSAGRA